MGEISPGAPGETPGKPKVFAINFALQSFAGSIGGELIEVEVPSLDGTSAGNFSPSTEQIIAIQDADLILLNGADFSPWTGRASLPSSKTVITARPFRKDWLESSHHHHGDHDHQHGPEGLAVGCALLHERHRVAVAVARAVVGSGL